MSCIGANKHHDVAPVHFDSSIWMTQKRGAIGSKKRNILRDRPRLQITHSFDILDESPFSQTDLETGTLKD